MENSILSHNIKYYRTLSGLTQEKLSEMLGISTQAVSKWEQGFSCPDINFLPQLSEIFNISIDELFGRMVDKEIVYSMDSSALWPDDNKLRIVIYSGRKMTHQSMYEMQPGKNSITFQCMDSFMDITGNCTYCCSNERQKNLANKFQK